MSVYPAVSVLISSVNKEHTAWTGKYFEFILQFHFDFIFVLFLFLDIYFVPVITYLLFSIFDFLGRVIPNIIKLVSSF